MRVLLALLFVGCTTVIKDPKTGKTIMILPANATNVTLTTSNLHFHADYLDHSTPTRAAGSLVGTIGTTLTATGLGVKVP